MTIKLASLLNILNMLKDDPVPYTRISFYWIADKSPKWRPKCRIWYILEKGVQTFTVETSE